MTKPFGMPVMGERGSAQLIVYFEATAADRAQAMSNHGQQTLERLRERGGVSWCELAAILSHRYWHRMDQDAARRECEPRQTHK